MYLVFNPVVGEVVQLLQHQNLEHQHHVLRLGARLAFAFLLMHPQQVMTKGFPVDQRIELTNGSPISVSLAARVSRSKNPGWLSGFIIGGSLWGGLVAIISDHYPSVATWSVKIDNYQRRLKD